MLGRRCWCGLLMGVTLTGSSLWAEGPVANAPPDRAGQVPRAGAPEVLLPREPNWHYPLGDLITPVAQLGPVGPTGPGGQGAPGTPGILDAPGALNVQGTFGAGGAASALGAPGTPPGTAAAGTFGQAPPAGSSLGGSGFYPKLLGDTVGLSSLGIVAVPSPLPPGFNGIRSGTPAVTTVAPPSVRNFKIADNDSAAPDDRVFLNFNYYSDVNAAVNRRLHADFSDLQAYREVFGLEKAFFDKRFSVELRLPLNTLSADSDIMGLSGTETSMGDLTVVGKYVLWRNEQTGSVLSEGMAVTAPTGAQTFAGSPAALPFHETILQPFVGYRLNSGKWILQGFTALDLPTQHRDVIVLYNDISLSYLLMQSQDPDRWITALAPTFEVHVNTPLDHRGAFNFADLAGTADVVDLTLGATALIRKRTTVAVGFVTPVTGPKPFAWEFLTQVNVFFGRQ